MPTPTQLTLHRASHILEVGFDDGSNFRLPAEYLRVNSPSAEVQGHGRKVLVAGKQDVGITGITPVGNYAVLLQFSDGHQTGIFSWQVLHELGLGYEANWATYLDALQAAGLSR